MRETLEIIHSIRGRNKGTRPRFGSLTGNSLVRYLTIETTAA